MRYSIRSVTPDQADLTFALARLGYPELTPETWRSAVSAAALMKPEQGGVLAAWDAQGQPHGLLVYSLVPALIGAPVLQIERLIAFDIFNPAAAGDALVRAAVDRPENPYARLSLVRGAEPLDVLAAHVLEADTSVLHKVV